MSDYSIDEHRHRFGLWAAARAAQRGLKGGSNEVLARALEASRVRSDSMKHLRTKIDSKQFDVLHTRWCSRIVSFLKKRKVDASHGRAAKLIAIYLKTTVVVVAGHEDTDLASVLHPPIDAILLDGLRRRLKKHGRDVSLPQTWTQLDKKPYLALIKFLRDEFTGPLWKVEKDWTVTGKR